MVRLVARTDVRRRQSDTQEHTTIEAIEPLTAVLQSKATSSPVITADAAAALSVSTAAFAAGYVGRGIGSAAMGVIAEDDDLFVNGLALAALPETLVVLVLIVAFAA